MVSLVQQGILRQPSKPTTYHREHLENIIPPEGFYQPQPNKTSQTDGDERNPQKNDGDDKDLFAATLEFYHREAKA